MHSGIVLDNKPVAKTGCKERGSETKQTRRTMLVQCRPQLKGPGPISRSYLCALGPKIRITSLFSVYIHIYMYVYIYMYLIRLYIYIHIYIYIHTHLEPREGAWLHVVRQEMSTELQHAALEIDDLRTELKEACRELAPSYPKGPLRVPLWNYVPKTLPYMVLGALIP